MKYSSGYPLPENQSKACQPEKVKVTNVKLMVSLLVPDTSKGEGEVKVKVAFTFTSHFKVEGEGN